jgi:hypothetical protein
LKGKRGKGGIEGGVLSFEVLGFRIQISGGKNFIVSN